jgi:hypothetical protein
MKMSMTHHILLRGEYVIFEHRTAFPRLSYILYLYIFLRILPSEYANAFYFTYSLKGKSMKMQSRIQSESHEKIRLRMGNSEPA